jgi:hypothetical protein
MVRIAGFARLGLLGCAVVAAVGSVPVRATAADLAVNCEALKLVAAANYASCRLKAERLALKQGLPMPDFSFCDAKFADKMALAESKFGAACPTVGDAAAVQDEITAQAEILAEALAGNGLNGVATCAADFQACTADLGTCTADLATCTASQGTCPADLSACVSDLGTCTSDLATTSASLGACTASLGTCTSDLGTTTASLGTCTASLGTCTSDLGTCNGSLGTCTSDLGTCNGSLSTCTGDLGTCNADLATTTASLATCTSDLGTCTTDLGTCSADLSTCMASQQRFPATGQTSCWNSSGSPISCAGTRHDGEIQAGETLAYQDNGDGTITDLNTKLQWEKLSDDGSVHDKDNTYVWDAAFASKVAQLNATNFAGYNDWRVPNAKELQSIVNYQNVGPAVSPAFNTGCAPGCSVTTCSCTVSDNPWSSTTYAVNPSFAWFVSLLDGHVHAYAETNPFRVRAVRRGL